MDSANSLAASAESKPHRVGFVFVRRFLYLYLLLNLLSMAANFPILGYLLVWYPWFWTVAVPWVTSLFGRSVHYVPSGSGDTTFLYVLSLCYLILSLAAAACWTLVRPASNDRSFRELVRLLARYSLAATMLGYGIAKIVKTQFPDVSLFRLVQPFGTFSPMGLAWSFMGFSYAYNAFVGLGEVLGGLLLFFRRTTTLGALILIVVLTNVVMINLTFDVPVKLFSLHLLFIAAFLVARDVRPLAHALLAERDPEDFPRPHRVPLGADWFEVKHLLLVAALAVPTIQNLALWRWLQNGPRTPLYGIYDVVEFRRNGDIVAPLLTDTTRWRRVIVASPGGIGIQRMDDKVTGLPVETDTVRRVLKNDSNGREIALTYSKPDAHQLLLSGRIGSDSLDVKLREVSTSEFTLVNRGFHWISENPVNQ